MVAFMSWSDADQPECSRHDVSDRVALSIAARTHDIGAFTVGRVLPSPQRRMVGPFIFFDHLGPARIEPGAGLDVRPHPHINLATITYLFAGEIHHRDSLGVHKAIQPGAINLMIAGRGIVHSERSGPEFRTRGGDIHGIQLWIALPRAFEEVPPAFHHHPAADFPEQSLGDGGARGRVLMGAAYGRRAPVRALSPIFYVDAQLAAGQRLQLPDAYEERAVYVVEGAVRVGETRLDARRMFVFEPGCTVTLEGEADARLMLLGGAPLDGPRYIWWNFVSSSEERIERAKQDWREGRFPKVPGDEDEFIPLPER